MIMTSFIFHDVESTSSSVTKGTIPGNVSTRSPTMGQYQG